MSPPLVVANWKMHCTEKEAAGLAREIRSGLRALKGVEIVLAPPFTALSAVRNAISKSGIKLGAQDIYWEIRGAFTGEISPEMLRGSGCEYVIIAHSERRRLFHETDRSANKKVSAALFQGLRPILCVGETWRERKQGKTARVVGRQLRGALKGLRKNAIESVVVAYEPVWAIGTGRNASAGQASEAHRGIRAILKKLAGKKRAGRCRILYGGSARPENAAELARAAEVNGLLVGGASLKARDFLSIIRCFVPELR